MLQRIGVVDEELSRLRATAGDLARFRLLVAGATGQTLEDLSISALNRVLRSTPARAEDRADVGREDFWVTSAEGDLALAEVKGIGTHVRRENVNQVDNGRSELDRAVEDLPGLLIVNIFRNEDDLDKRILPVSPDVVRHSARLNVLTMRTWDLFHLLSLAIADEAVGSRFLEMLTQGGGGWLEVDEEMRFHRE